jgi:hypothetical protein
MTSTPGSWPSPVCKSQRAGCFKGPPQNARWHPDEAAPLGGAGSENSLIEGSRCRKLGRTSPTRCRASDQRFPGGTIVLMDTSLALAFYLNNKNSILRGNVPLDLSQSTRNYAFMMVPVGATH